MAYHVGNVLEDLAQTITEICERKGFWDYDEEQDLFVIPTKLALVHEEVSEALRVHREDYDDAKADSISGMTPMQEDDFTEELADVIIRVLDLCGFYELPIGDVLVAKVEKNRSRPSKHNKRY